MTEQSQSKDVYFSIALDETIDRTNSAEVYFIPVVTEDIHCHEELLTLDMLTGEEDWWD